MGLGNVAGELARSLAPDGLGPSCLGAAGQSFFTQRRFDLHAPSAGLLSAAFNCHAGTTANSFSMNRKMEQSNWEARPHPGPLPQERVTLFPHNGSMGALDWQRFRGSMRESLEEIPLWPSPPRRRNRCSRVWYSHVTLADGCFKTSTHAFSLGSAFFAWLPAAGG
jgi:hypothetical protein